MRAILDRAAQNRPARIQTARSSWLLAATALLSVSACAVYRPEPLAPEADTVLRGRDVSALAGSAAALRHPRLAPVVIDPTKPLTPEAVGVLAVVGDPDLKAQRAAAGVASAQLFAAGLLPDPQVNLSYDGRLSGPDPTNGWAVALAYELNSLRTHGVEVESARAARDQARLDLAWQEWQVAGQGRLLAARVQGLSRVAELALDAKAAADAALARALQSAARGDVRADEVETRRLAAADAADKARQSQSDLETARLDLDKLLGLPPETVVALAPIGPAADLNVDAEVLFERARTLRLDLLALEAGYHSQEAATRKAVMDQFPSLQLTLTRTQDTARNQTFGPAVNFTLPVWSRNRGGIAIARATRAQLRAEYAARVFQTRADIAELAGALRLEGRRRAEVAAQIGPFHALVRDTEAAARGGDVARTTAEAVRQSLLDKEAALAVLDEAMAEQETTLELAVGSLIPEIHHAP